ncbi:hypothetical protein N7520_005194 [Penicillium odoratum]|uniref:uncharacterized protein n=1 Tax=Penicillium odoratum TaxID=1167516 RepID=UPI002547CE1E|nr:uncharacterized protein N7520_005194 [Penicillium odoratum]KAJ5765635.1 hypothetical protein N7520_005194 [Penicillium odoratum]
MPTSRAQRGLKASVDPQINERIERKRVQNRISQRCAREKKAAQRLHMAEFRDLVKNSARDTQGSNTVIFNAYVELLQENERLSEALLTMRKKLLSISNNSASVADDPIFESILNRQKKEKASPEFQARELDSNLLQSDHNLTASLGMSQMEQNPIQSFEFPISCEDVSIWDLINLPGPLSCSLGAGNSISGSCNPLALPSVIGSELSDRLFDHEGRMSSMCITDCIEIACVVYKCEELHLPIVSQITSPASLKPLKDQYKDWVSQELIDRTSKVAIQAMTSWTGLTKYVNSTGTHELMESIMRWRFAPTSKNLAAIQKLFRPTPMQENCTHSAVIDMVPWPELREYFLTLDSKNLDTAIWDTVLNIVIDLPQLQMSLNVFDMVCNAIVRAPDTPVISESELRGKLQGRESKCSVGDQAFFYRLWLDIVHRMASVDPDVVTNSNDVNQQRRALLVRNLEVDRWPDWRLSGNFTSIYPLSQEQITACSLLA